MNSFSVSLLGWIAAALVLASGRTLGAIPETPPEEGTPILWGRASNENTPPGLTDLVAVEAGENSVVGIRRNGSVVFWNANGGALQQTPPGLTNIVAIAARGAFQLALHRNGNITGWGADGHVFRDSIINPPEWLTNVVAIEAGYDSSAALTSDGYLIQWGSGHLGPLQGPMSPVQPRSFTVGQQFMLLVGNDGRITGWGNPINGSLSIPTAATNMVQVEGGVYGHVVGLRADGRVLAWGTGNAGQTLVPAAASPAHLVAAGYQHSVSVLTNGTPVTWGDPVAAAFSPLPRIFRVAAGNGFSVGLTLAPVNRQGFDYRNVARGADLVLTSRFESTRPFSVRWLRDGVEIPGASGARLVLTNFQSQALTRFVPFAFNEHGESTGGEFAVQPQDAPPSFPQADDGTSALPGEEVVLEAGARGSEPMTYQWYRNGTPIPDATSARLVVPHGPTAALDEYQVEASNAFGSLRSAPRIVAIGLAGCIRPPQSVDLLPGMPLRLATLWISKEPPAFQWLRDGAPIADATNATLELTPNVVGDFRLVATTGFGSTTSRVGRVRIRPDFPVGPPAAAVVWGATTFGDLVTPRDLTNVVELAVGDSHAIALLPDGRARMWVSPAISEFFPPIRPGLLTNVASVAAGNRAAAAIRRDGSVLAWGRSTPSIPIPEGLREVVQVAFGFEYGMALHRDGTVSVWPPPLRPPDGLSDVVEIEAFGSEARARRSDGSLWIWHTQNPPGVQRVDSPELRRVSGNLGLMRAGEVERLSDGRWIPEVPTPPRSVDLADLSLAQIYIPNEGAPVIADRFGLGFLRPPEGLLGVHRLVRSDNTLGALTRLPFVVSVSGATNAPTGTDLRLSSDVLSSSPVGFQWLRDGVPVPGAVAPELSLRRLRFRDAGEYTLRLANASGIVTSPPVRITLYGPPEFDAPVPVSANAGETAVLEMFASGPGPITYQWRFNGEILPGATRSRLVLSNAQSTLSGRYELVARNAHGESVAPGVRLTVVPRQPLVTLDASPRDFPEGGTLTLQGTATGTEPFAYRWLLDGQPIPNQSSRTLRISETTANLSGPYRLEVSNPVGVTLSEPIDIRVQPSAPGAEAPPRWRLANERSLFEWTAPVHGSAPLRIQWYREGLPLENATNRTLRIPVLGASDAGSYSVATTNALGFGLVLVGELKVLPGLGAGAPAGWGSLLPPDGTGILQAISAGVDHVLGVRPDGTVVGWGRNDVGQTAPPADLDRVVAVAAGAGFSAALKDDGNVVVWGNVTNGLDRIPAGLRHVTALAAGTSHIIALDEDGRITAWGAATGAVLNVPATATNVVAIAAGGYGTTVVRRDGRAVSWGNEAPSIPASATNLVSAAVAARTGVGLNATGRLFRLGSAAFSPPTTVSNAIRVATSGGHGLALRSDGTVVAWPSANPESLVPTGLSNFVAVAAGRGFSVALTRSAVVAGRSGSWTVRGDAPLEFTPAVSGFEPISYQWLLDGLPIADATNATVRLEPSELRTGRNLALRVTNPHQSWTGPTLRMSVVTDVGVEIRSVPVDDFSPLGIRVRLRATGASVGILESWSQGTWQPLIQLGLGTGSAEYMPTPGEESALYRLRIP